MPVRDENVGLEIRNDVYLHRVSIQSTMVVSKYGISESTRLVNKIHKNQPRVRTKWFVYKEHGTKV